MVSRSSYSRVPVVLVLAVVSVLELVALPFVMQGVKTAGAAMLLFGVSEILLGVAMATRRNLLFGVGMLLVGIAVLQFGVLGLIHGQLLISKASEAQEWAQLGAASLLFGIALVLFTLMALLNRNSLPGLALIPFGMAGPPIGLVAMLWGWELIFAVVVLFFGAVFLLIGVLLLVFGVRAMQDQQRLTHIISYLSEAE